MQIRARAPAHSSAGTRLERRGWLLWAFTFAVILALTGTIPLLYHAFLVLLDTSGERDEWNAMGYYTEIGLVGLVLIFCLYTVMKQRELNEARRLISREERELEEVRTRLSELTALFETSTTLNLQIRLDTILEIIVRRVVDTLKAQQASIMLYDPASETLETRASYGLESEFARHARKRLGEGIAGWVAEHGEALLLNDRPPGDAHGQHYKANRHITSALSLPLRVGRRCVGVLNVNRINHPSKFQEHHRDLLRLFADHVGAVIERAEAMERLEGRATNLEADNLRLLETNRMKDVFLSTATHELKTPLTSVIAYAEILDENEGTLEPARRAQFMRALRAEARRLLELIEEILDLSRLETGKLALHRDARSINDVARSAVETSKVMAERHGITVVERFDFSLPDIRIDEVKIRQALVNLLTNAIKFSPRSGTVTVRTRRDGEHIVAEVVDHGPGIRPEESTHIFELFGQGARQSERRPSGLGIGLHLVKRLVELHGGLVGVNSIEGAGSTFWIRLPAAAAEARREAA